MPHTLTNPSPDDTLYDACRRLISTGKDVRITAWPYHIAVDGFTLAITMVKVDGAGLGIDQ